MIAEHFPATGTVDSLSLALEWASTRLTDAGVSVGDDPVAAIKALRGGESTLGLKTLRYLVHQLSQR